MEELSVSSGVIVDAGTLDSLHPDAWRLRVALRDTFARFGCAALLLVAAALKGHQLFTDPALRLLHGSRSLQAGLVEYELLLASWLLSGVRLHLARRFALFTFLGFSGYAAFLGASGEASCG